MRGRCGSSPCSTACAWASPGFRCTRWCSTAGPSAASCSGHPLETADVGWFARTPCRCPSPGVDRWGPAAFAAIRGEPVEVQFDRPARRSGAATSQLSPQRAGRAARRRSTRLPPARLPLVADAVVVDEAGRRRARCRAPRSRRRERRRLDLVAVGRERLEAVPQLVERRRRLVAVGERERGHREQLVGVDVRGRRDSRRPDGAATRASRRRGRRRGATPVSRSRRRRPARRSVRRGPGSARASPATRRSARAPRQSPC